MTDLWHDEVERLEATAAHADLDAEVIEQLTIGRRRHAKRTHEYFSEERTPSRARNL